MNENFMYFAKHGKIFIRCVPVLRQRFVTEGFTLKTGNYDKDVKEVFGMGKLFTVKQVHGDKVLKITKKHMKKMRKEKADALITNEPGIPVAVRVADCVANILIDPQKKAVAAVHSGWRGVENKLVIKALDAMKKAYKTKPSGLLAVMSASIMPCCYEVGEEVYDRMKKDKVFKDVFTVKNGKIYMDMKKGNYNMLIKAGVKKENIFINDTCTKCGPEDKFYSYRREGKKAGRHVGFVMIKPV